MCLCFQRLEIASQHCLRKKKTSAISATFEFSIQPFEGAPFPTADCTKVDTFTVLLHCFQRKTSEKSPVQLQTADRDKPVNMVRHLANREPDISKQETKHRAYRCEENMCASSCLASHKQSFFLKKQNKTKQHKK